MSVYDGKLLNLSSKFLFVAFYEESNNTLMGKLIDTTTKDSWKPGNLTTAFLLYLLGQEGDIPYEEFKKLINLKFRHVTDGKIDAFLDNLPAGALEISGTTPAVKIDPLGCFSASGKMVNWEDLELNKDGLNAEVGARRVFSKGYYMITFWK